MTSLVLGMAFSAGACPTTQAVQAILDDTVARDASVPGVIVAVSAPRLELEWAGAAGRVALGSAQPLTPKHAFRIASITKVYVAATVMQMRMIMGMSLGDGFNVKDIWEKGRRNWGQLLAVTLVPMAIVIGISLVLSIVVFSIMFL